MRKIAKILITLMAILLFFTLFFIEGNNNFRNVLDTHMLFEQEQYKNQDIVLLNFDEDFRKDQVAVHTLLNIFEENNACAFGYHAYKGSQLQNRYIYIYAKESDEFSRQLGIDKADYIDFSNTNEDRYYVISNKNEYTNGIQIDLLNPMFYLYFDSFPTQYRPMNQMNENYGPKMIQVISRDNDILCEKVYREKTISKYLKSIDRIEKRFAGGLLEEEGLVYDVDKITSLILVVCCISLILTISVDMMKRKKQIAIYKLNGFSSNRIILKTFIPFLLQIYAIFVVVLNSLAWLIVGNYNNINCHLYAKITAINKYFTIIMIILVIVIIVLINVYKNLNDLKNKNISSKFLSASLICKLIFTLSLLSPFIYMMNETYLQCKETLSLYNYYESAKERYYLKVIDNKSSEIGGNIKIMSSIYTYLAKEYNAKCYDCMSWYAMNDVYSTDESLPEEYKDEYVTPYVIVNKNYLKDYVPIYDENRQKININTLVDGVLLVPKAHKESKSLDVYKKNFSCEKVIYIDNQRDKYKELYFAKEKYNEYCNNPIIYVSDESNLQSVSYMNTNLYVDTNNIAKINDEIVAMGYEDNVIFEWLYPATTKEFNKQFIILVPGLLFFVMYCFVYITFLYQNVYTYMEINKRKYTIQYLHGFSYIKRYGEIYLINVAIFLLAGIHCVVKQGVSIKQIVSSILFLCLLEILFTYVLINRFEKNESIKSLK